MFVLLLTSCTEPPPAGAVFVRGGLLVGEGRTFVERRWTPGEEIAPGEVAPRVASCVPLFHVPLADASAAVARGGESPDTVIAFSPDGEALAIGAWTGEVVVADAWTGEERARIRLAETLVREVAWSLDGRTVYAAEQSPDAYVHALDAADLRSRARIRLADHVSSSPLPPGDDLYGAYTLPAAYALRVLPDGSVLVAASHGWNEGEVRRNAARVLRLDADLAVRAAWPATGAADAALGAFDTDGERVAVAVRRSAAGPAPADLPVDGIQLLAVADLSSIGAERFDVLPPFGSVFVWDALALVPEGIVAGLGDGRVELRAGGASVVEPVGVPRLAGAVPIAASVGFLRVSGERMFAVTSRTTIPYGSARPELRPPELHPNENTLFAWTLEGGELQRLWHARVPHDLAGLAVAGNEVVVGAGPREDGRTDLFGALVFAAGGDGRPAATCATEGPVFFRPVVSGDGRIAVAEVPWRDGDAVRGAYRVTVLR